MNWDDLRFFLAVARRRTQAAAARELKVAQPTIGRRIAALEEELGAQLFTKRSDGYVLSRAGSEVLANAERIEQEALAVEHRVSGRDVGLRGIVRVTASEWMVTGVLCTAIAPFVARNPEVTIELVAEQRHVNLARREADIALRPRRFEHDAILQRSAGKIAFGLYASRAYVAKRGLPTGGDGRGHALVAMAADVGDVARDWLDDTLPGAQVVARTNGRDAMLALAVAGVALACLPRIVGDAAPALKHIALPSAPTPTLWLGMHRDARAAPRVRALAAHLAKRLQDLAPRLAPDA
jgi:DNA-binding transcriptional LysR family regulator